MDQLRLGEPPAPLLKFKVIGYIGSPAFQKCCYYVKRLHTYFPKLYSSPEIRSLFDLDWEYYITKMRRRYGKQYYMLQKKVAVYLDGELMGDDTEFLEYMSKKYYTDTSINFDDVCTQELIKFFTNITELKRRQLVYLTIAVAGRVIGTMLFLLYNDLVPTVCANFFARCKSRKLGETYRGTPVHRAVKNGWLQCGGFTLHHVNMPCENYVVPHDRKGVLSMCNQFRHVDNSSQFFVTLDPAPWLDYRYVAFGQLLHGVDVLNALVRVPAYHQAPRERIEIAACGEYNLCSDAAADDDGGLPDAGLDPNVNPELLTAFLNAPTVLDADIDYRDTRSIMDLHKYKAGKYCFRSDLRSYFPFVHLPSSWMEYFDGDKDNLEDAGEDRDDYKNEKSAKLPVATTQIHKSLHEFTIDDHFYV